MKIKNQLLPLARPVQIPFFISWFDLGVRCETFQTAEISLHAATVSFAHRIVRRIAKPSRKLTQMTWQEEVGNPLLDPVLVSAVAAHKFPFHDFRLEQ